MVVLQLEFCLLDETESAKRAGTLGKRRETPGVQSPSDTG